MSSYSPERDPEIKKFQTYTKVIGFNNKSKILGELFYGKFLKIILSKLETEATKFMKMFLDIIALVNN